jgi:hypothetical protein
LARGRTARDSIRPVGAPRWRAIQRAPTAATAAAVRRSAAGNQDRRGGVRGVVSGSDAPLRANARSRADWKRSSGLFSRHLRMIRVWGPDDAGNSGVSLRIAAEVSAGVRAAKARRPVAISYRTQPNAKMSLRTSAVCPFTCSGDM